MNKGDLIDRVAGMTNLSKKDTAAAVDAVFDSIASALAQGDKVQIVGFGSFEVRERAARSGRNPQTGEPMEIEARRVAVFKPGKTLKESVMNETVNV